MHRGQTFFTCHINSPRGIWYGIYGYVIAQVAKGHCLASLNSPWGNAMLDIVLITLPMVTLQWGKMARLEHPPFKAQTVLLLGETSKFPTVGWQNYAGETLVTCLYATSQERPFVPSVRIKYLNVMNWNFKKKRCWLYTEFVLLIGPLKHSIKQCMYIHVLCYDCQMCNSVPLWYWDNGRHWMTWKSWAV